MATAHADENVHDVPFPSAEAMQCPYPLYNALRETEPLYQLSTGEYVISRHEDAQHVTRHPEIFSSHASVFEDGWMRAATLDDHRNPDYPWGIVTSDTPDHPVKRKVAFEMFKPGRLRTREPMVRDYADGLIDTFIDRGECEFVSEFACRLPAKVILTLFGLPLEFLDRAMAWGRYEGNGTRYASPERRAHARDGILDLGAFLRERILERVENPTEDDLSLHVQRHMAQHGELDIANMVSEASNLFIGGIITTTHLLSSMMMLFIRHPEQQEIARRDSGTLKRAIEEVLRVESPVQIIPRLVVQDTEMHGVSMPAGSSVLVLLGSANRDTCAFADPDAFEVQRDNVKNHLAFGNGPHFCMGAPLARMEAVVAFEQIFSRLPNLRFAEGNTFANDHTVIFRGPERLLIEFDHAS
jgi:cytochrome P450